MDQDLVARNIIILLIAFSFGDTAEVVDCIMHVWYSAFLSSKHIERLQNCVVPLLDDVNRKIKDRATGVQLGKTWTFASCTLRVVLTKERWNALASYLKVPEGLTASRAQEARKTVMYATADLDVQERRYYAQPLRRRVCLEKYREDGILLPFGHSREDFNVPNPYVFMHPKVSL